MKMKSLVSDVLLVTGCLLICSTVLRGDEPQVKVKPHEAPRLSHPLSKEKRTAMKTKFEDEIVQMSKMIASNPKNVGFYSRRADAYFYLGDFEKALGDYEKMVELQEGLANAHWRRGIARFYAKKYKDAAHQFEIYHSFDDVDRENGIWRYFSQYKAYGKKKAREGLLKYKKDDREPFPSVYRLFSGELEPDAILKSIAEAKVSKTEREKRLFYANLYIGLNYSLDGQDKLAAKYLRDSTDNKWAPGISYGPNYMWHVGRLHFELLNEKPKDKQPKTRQPRNSKDK